MSDWRKEDMKKQEHLLVKLTEWLKGDMGAVRFVMDIVYLSHLWDDLVDKDRERTAQEINMAFKTALFHMLENPFYARYIGELKPVMVNAYLNWHASNVVEDSTKAWFLRASIYNIVIQCAYLVGGMEWAESVAPQIWDYYEEVPNA